MGKISLVFIIVMASATYYLTSTSFQSSQSLQQNRTWIDETGKLHVLGLTLGKSTVRDAEIALRSRADAAIFMYPLHDEGKEKKFKLVLEAYFPSIADHSKVMLTLDVEEQQLEAIRQRSTSPRLYPNGVARMNLGNEDILAVLKFTIHTLTLIPSTQLDAAILKAQFGNPKRINTVNKHITTYLYPNLGLTASINDSGKDKLVFTSPKHQSIMPAIQTERQ
ncbi:MAG: hypothetical protein Q9M19_01465 [Mariprofundaceae bacterium]|nr:hypothetical protein [Mariprofundaceae bacterium]